MKKVILLVALFVSPVFAQEEEQEVQIEIETGGVEVAVTGEFNRAIAAYPDKSAWMWGEDDEISYCWLDENEEPRCKEIEVED